jgi:hypothetical protein
MTGVRSTGTGRERIRKESKAVQEEYKPWADLPLTQEEYEAWMRELGDPDYVAESQDG